MTRRFEFEKISIISCLHNLAKIQKFSVKLKKQVQANSIDFRYKFIRQGNMAIAKDTLLLIEDDPNDIILFEKAVKKNKLPVEFNVVRDGEKAISYLSGCGKYKNRKDYPLPNLIVVDLKLPRKSGFEVLEWVKGHPELKNIPVVVLSSSKQTQDVKLAYRLGTNSYLVKPIGFKELHKLVEVLGQYWLTYNENPR